MIFEKLKENTCKEPFFIFSFLLLILMSCQSKPGTMEFDTGNTFKKSTSDNLISDKKIDTGKTYEIYFSLKKNEDCIKVAVISKVMDEATFSEKIIRTFFVVEKNIDISGFRKSNKKRIFFELARNFNDSWDREKDVTICSSEADPIKKLSKGIYRIRFSVFRETDFNFEISIHSENAVKIESF